MTLSRPAEYLASLLHELCALPRETEWVEFKVNESEPQAIGEYISALANAAALVGKAFAYLVWGVRDEDHAIVGTSFHRPLASMDKSDRVRACYLHACLRYVTRKPMTNASLRERFGIADRNASMASRLLNEAVEAGVIAVADPEVGTRARSYVPFWVAAPSISKELA